MEEQNSLQKAFLSAMASIQETCVQTALCQNQDALLEERFYDLAGEVIVRVMEVLDGYGGAEIDRLRITSEKTGGSLTDKPGIQLHDAVCGYLRRME